MSNHSIESNIEKDLVILNNQNIYIYICDRTEIGSTTYRFENRIFDNIYKFYRTDNELLVL